MPDLRALAPLVVPADPALFFTKNDLDDPRMGDRTPRLDEDAPSGDAPSGDAPSGDAPSGDAPAGDVPVAARVALIGVPQDVGVARNGGRIGAAAAPDAIRAMLYRMTPYDAAGDRSVPHGFLIDLGNVRADGELEEIHERLTDAVRIVCAAGMIPLVLGGGHDITYASARGVHAAHGTLGMLNLDAHLDVRPPAPLRTSGTSFRMLIDEAMVLPQNMVEFGIQSFANAEAHARWLIDRGGTIITLDEVRARGFGASIEAACNRACSAALPLYATLDMDGVRAADAPGVSAAMPNGFSAAELLAAARLVGRRPATVALDIAEVNPLFDRDNITAKLAAHAAMHFVAGVMERPT